MKKIIVALSMVLAVSTVSAQHFLGGRTQVISGVGGQEGKFAAIGLGIQYQGFIEPDSKIGIVVTGERNFLGAESKRIALTSGTTDVHFVSTMYRLTAGAIYIPFKESAVSPFISLQTGFLMNSTDLTIDEPFNSFCSPVQNQNVKLSFSLAGNVESGIRFRLSRKGGHDLMGMIGAGYTHGTRSKYIKLDADPETKSTMPFTAKFKDSDGNTHSHQIGTLYRTETSQVNYFLGLTYQIF